MNVPAMDLTNTATIARRAIVISIVLFVLSIISFISYQIYKNYKIANTPPPQEEADFKYGTLDSPAFPKTLAPSNKYTYSVDTKTGGLGDFPNTIRVYFLPKPFATLLATEKANQLAAKFGIDTNPQIQTETKYLYSVDDRRITVEIDSTNFNYSQDNLEEADLGPVEEDNQLVQGFNNILSSRNLVKDDIRDGRTKVILANIAGSNVTPVSSRSEANGAIISIWPNDLDKKPIVTPEFNKALINAVVQTTARGLENYKELNYTFWQIDSRAFSVYPLKKPQQALEELQKGSGVVVLAPASSDVSISAVYLAYYQPAQVDWSSPYLQPVYVFEGPNFAAYVSAVGSQSEPAK